MKKIVCLLAFFLFGITILFAGGSGEALEAGVNDEVTIKISFYGGPTPTKKMYEIIEEFKKANPSVTVETTASDWTGHYEKLKAQLAAGAGPTLYLLDGPYVPQYAERKILVDLTDRVKAEIDAADYFGLDTVRDPNGRLWAVPQGIQVNVLYYNKDMFDAMGVAYPTPDWTTDDVIDAAKKLTTAEHWGIALPNHIRYGWYTVIKQFGGDTLDATRRKSTILSDPQVREALEYMYDAWHVHKVAPTFEDIAGELGSKYNTYFTRNKIAMFYDCYQMKLRAEEAGINYDVQLIPRGSNSMGQHYTPFVANCWVLNNNASGIEKETGWAFIKFYLGDQAQKIHAEVGESMPANINICREMISKMTSPGNKTVFLDSMQYAGGLGENAVWEEWFVSFQNVLADYFGGKASLDDTLAKGNKVVQDILDEYYEN